MNVAQYLNSSNLLGRVVRNSEFDKREDKLAATKLYLDSVNRSFIVFCTVISDLIERVLENKEAKDKLTEADLRGIQYVLAKILFGIFVDASNRSLASEKLIPIYAELLANEANTSARILLCGLMLELGAPGWDDEWERLIEDSEKKRFVLDFLLDRLWELIHTRPLGEADRSRVEALATQIERKFLPGFSNATLISSIRESARSTQRRDKAEQD